MSIEGKNFDGDVSDEKMIITYKRRGVYNESPNPQGTSLKRTKKTKEKDIGWFHGEMLNGVNQHWRCNYCGMTRHGGGVTRLKRHLVGHKDVRKCPYVPDQVVEEIRRNWHLKEKEVPLINLNWNVKKRRKGTSRAGPSPQVKEGEEIVKEEVDDVDSDASVPESDKPEKNLEDNVQHFSLGCMAERHESTNHEVGNYESDVDQPIDLYRSRCCSHCQFEITNNWGLVSCKGCNTSFHTSCINPFILGSIESWYCSACIGKKPDLPVTIDDTDSEEGNSEILQPCITSMYRLCKICGIRADGEREFLVCSHPECPYKYYHTACLKKSRISINMRENSTCWFCPSCLCRVCRRNQDDPLIVLCDGCDEACHIYCMDPPCDSVPQGKWYCGKCTMKRRRKRGKRENGMQVSNLKEFKKNVVMPNIQVNDAGKNEYKKEHQPMDLLMSAIDTISAQEKPPS